MQNKFMKRYNLVIMLAVFALIGFFSSTKTVFADISQEWIKDNSETKMQVNNITKSTDGNFIYAAGVKEDKISLQKFGRIIKLEADSGNIIWEYDNPSGKSSYLGITNWADKVFVYGQDDIFSGQYFIQEWIVNADKSLSPGWKVFINQPRIYLPEIINITTDGNRLYIVTPLLAVSGTFSTLKLESRSIVNGSLNWESPEFSPSFRSFNEQISFDANNIYVGYNNNPNATDLGNWAVKAFAKSDGSELPMNITQAETGTFWDMAIDSSDLYIASMNIANIYSISKYSLNDGSRIWVSRTPNANLGYMSIDNNFIYAAIGEAGIIKISKLSAINGNLIKKIATSPQPGLNLLIIRPDEIFSKENNNLFFYLKELISPS